jgi:hypothetical protein
VENVEKTVEDSLVNQVHLHGNPVTDLEKASEFHRKALKMRLLFKTKIKVTGVALRG